MRNADHRITRDELGEFLLAAAFGSGRTHRQNKIPHVGSAVVNANGNAIVNVEPKFMQHLAWLARRAGAEPESRREDDEDRRMKRVCLTDGGRTVIRRLNAARLSGLEQFAKTLSPAERRALAAALTKLLERDALAACRPEGWVGTRS